MAKKKLRLGQFVELTKNSETLEMGEVFKVVGILQPKCEELRVIHVYGPRDTYTLTKDYVTPAFWWRCEYCGNMILASSDSDFCTECGDYNLEFLGQFIAD